MKKKVVLCISGGILLGLALGLYFGLRKETEKEKEKKPQDRPNLLLEPFLPRPSVAGMVTVADLPANSELHENINGVNVYVWSGDIVKLQVDAISNAANESCLGGNGIDGAIHTAADTNLFQKEITSVLKPDSSGVLCPTGTAQVVRATGNLPSKFVFQAVGPVYTVATEATAKDQLTKVYENIIKGSDLYKFESIAVPGISTAIYGYPYDKAEEIATKVLIDRIKKGGSDLKHVVFVVYKGGSNEAQEIQILKDKINSLK